MAYPAMSVAQAHALLTAKDSPFEMEEIVSNGIAMRAYKHAPPNLKFIFEASRSWGDLPFVVYEGERISYEAMANAAAKLAHDFVHKYGIKKGDRVAIIMRNLPEWVCAFWAGVLSGAIIAPQNAWWTSEELEYGLNDCGAKLVIADDNNFKKIVPIIPHLKEAKHFLIARGEGVLPKNAEYMEELIGKAVDWYKIPHTEAPNIALHPDDIVTIFYTSGTTGQSKGAYGNHRNIITNLLNIMVANARSFLRRGEKPPEPDPTLPRKAGLLSVPLFHVTACHAVMIVSMAAGNKMVMTYKWDPLQALEVIESEKITSLGGVPTIAWQILEHPRFKEFDVSSVETVSYGGAPSAAELVRRVVEGFPNVQPGQGYGLSETSAVVTSNMGEDYAARPLSCGLVAPVNDVKVVDDERKEVKLGEVGELLIKGPNIVMGYWNKPEATAQSFHEGWFRTGDLVKMDEEGFLYIVDRAKDVIIRGGENIYCTEVEDILYQHPKIFDAAIIGVPHVQLGEEVGAAIAVKPGDDVNLNEIQAHVRAHLAPFKVPVYLKVFTEPLPRNANGKILKRELKKLFAQS